MWTRSVILPWILFIFIYRSVLCQELPKLNPLSLPESLSINSRARLLCVASSGDQPIDFQWLKDGVLLSYGKIEQLDEWTSSLTINPLSLEHIGNYTCKASNSFGTNYVTSPLFVTAPPRWVIEPTNLQIRAGKSAILHCSAEGSPKVKISWKRKSESQQNLVSVLSGDNFRVYENGSLLISNAQKSKSGTYECEAFNGIGSGLQKRIELIVFESPTVERIVDHVIVERGQTAYLSCLARGDPPLSFEWLRDHRSLSDRPGVSERISFSELPSLENTQFTIAIINAKPTDEGLYSCLARNEFGSDEKDVRLMLVERPKPPQFVEVADIWSSSVRIKWRPADNGNSPILSYTVEYWRNPGGHWNITVSSSSTTAILRGLKPFTTYSFHIWASNSVGDSDPSQQGQFTTAKEEPSATPVNVKVEDKGSKFVRISWEPPPQAEWNGELLGYYVGYKQKTSDLPYTFNTVEADETNSYHYMLRGLRPGTEYLITVRAFNEVGSGPSSEDILIRTHDKESLPHPTLLIQDIGSTFIQVKWNTVDEFKSSISGYTIHYRKNGNKWNEISIPDAYQHAYTLTNLDPAVPYQIYVTSHGYTGVSEPSEIATIRTSPEAIFQPTPPSSQVQPAAVDDVTQILYIVVPVAVATVIIVIVIVSACVYVYSKRPLPPLHTYGDLPASKNFSYMHTAPRQRDIPITISGNNVMRYGSPYSTVPLTRPEQEDDEPIYESVVGDTLRKIKERSFDDDFKISNATIV
ncbi:cell adhesion molecule Dscam2-like [Argiope bruennichi]|uniref:Down syndrome cell adhesion molecule-like n=1 Tax=Argiope bruennichi TaxID=94029 RepID=A0A8T0DYL8_ARGBR|nr:cell adhesion molecule Dscam2-like [Argiope bruennichi]KAF8763618.1 Down syndrome cell adhesion molecule-like [Argiope bruennichi]